MTPAPDTQPPSPGDRPARLRILMPILLSVAALVLFLALFWHDGGHGKKGHGRRGQAASNRSPVGGQDDELEDLGNGRVTGKGSGGSPVGGGAKRSGGGKGDAWWAPDGKHSGDGGEDGWWAPEDKGRSGSESPVGGGGSGGESPVGGKARSTRAAEPSSQNPGEAAGEKGPDDFWWRK